MGFNSKQNWLCSTSISLENKKMLLKTYLWSIAIFGCATWTIGEAERKRLEVFEMSCFRRMRNIKWMDRITNEEVLGRIGERRTLWKSLRKRRGQMMGHTHTETHGELLRGWYLGGEEKGKAQIKIFRPNNWGYGRGETFRELARDRAEWRRVVASNQS